jgi:hypothetical protein
VLAFPLPVKRGEGAERSEAGEGLSRLIHMRLTRLDAPRLATLSPLRGARALPFLDFPTPRR